ncbi:MAG: sugar ABC transporter ATP-binding protein [Anaerolineales bacterium]|nr:sugar ABC transporter ATP-binding protein [Anaerolineales bacterium]
MTVVQPFLRIHNLSKTYPGVEALKGVSFDICRGHVHALVGENGAGKSTLIKILAGAVLPEHGSEVRIDGKAYKPQNPADALKASVSTIYQNMNLMPDRTIMFNILLGKEPAHSGLIDFSVMREKTQAVLETLNASYLDPDRVVGSLKIGEKQVVEIAKALINKSKFLIMDEPTAALNQAEAEALFKNIRSLRESGVTILYVSHRLDEIFDLADTVTVLRDGHHISTRPIGEVTRSGLVEEMIGRKLSSIFPDKTNHPGEEILRVEGLNSGKHLRNISFSLHRGEVLAVAGLSGSGKADLGKALFGALPLDAGSLWVNGRVYHPSPSDAFKNQIIFLPEDRKADGVIQELSIRRNLALSVLHTQVADKLGILNTKKENKVAQKQIKALEIKTPSMEQKVSNLSGGNQQKVALGRCLAVDPEIFILMEPTQGIDVGVKFEIYQFILQQAAEDRAIVLISSELPEILGLADRILVMNEGRITAELSAEKTSQEEILQYALGESE